ncbi:MAG: BrnT family toxin [Fibrobacter sp.]|nr:BrnT family toxin [Fibrobacteraceae bacterium]MCF0224832.1 BrnT family toxin [Fibrobacter sp.]
MDVLFEWDSQKEKINIKKHGVSFSEAKSCFEDDFAEIFADDAHSQNEDRSILIGMSSILRTLVVVFTERVPKDGTFVNRIISARKATKKESDYYWSKRKGSLK